MSSASGREYVIVTPMGEVDSWVGAIRAEDARGNFLTVEVGSLPGRGRFRQFNLREVEQVDRFVGTRGAAKEFARQKTLERMSGCDVCGELFWDYQLLHVGPESSTGETYYCRGCSQKGPE